MKADVAEAVEPVSAYVYQRWLFDLGLKIENTPSEAEAVRLERDVRGFVKGLVKALSSTAVRQSAFDWKTRRQSVRSGSL